MIKSDKSRSAVSGGTPFLGMLTILFIGLKLTGHISWSWWWVLSPMWIPFLLAVVVVVFAIIVHLAVNK